jgi:hypothetical protein
MKKNISALLIALSLLNFTACNKDKEGVGTATLHVRLTDAPGDYEAVYVDVQGVEINVTETADDKSGWIKLKNIQPGIYDLLKLTNGVDALIASDVIPAGKISQIRLILGDKNSVVMNGKTYTLKTPSALQSGLKLKVNTTLLDGIVYTMLLDFDASRSIVSAGSSGNYNLKPVIRTVVEAKSGAIKGIVSPVHQSAVYAIAGTDTVGTYTNTDGAFLIKGLHAGSYKVVLQPSEELSAETIENVSVTIGTVTNVGIVAIE